jgi:hypothetical protein
LSPAGAATDDDVIASALELRLVVGLIFSGGECVLDCRSGKSGGETERANCGEESASAQLTACHLVQKDLYRWS